MINDHFVYDTFPFSNELDLLELRFNELDQIVDRFVIVEGTQTYTGHPKPLYFSDNLRRFAKWFHKITHVIVDDFPATEDPWTNERWQRDAIMRGLSDCRDDDVIILGDADEIPRAEVVAAYRPTQGLCRLKQRLFYCYANYENLQGWDWLRIMPFSILKERTPCGVRYPPDDLPIIENGGWHFSFMGGPERWLEKLDNTAHQEYNTSAYRNVEQMKAQIALGKDPLLREELTYQFVPIDESYPAFMRENLRRFQENKFIYGRFMHPEAYQFVADVKKDHPEFFVGKKVLEVGSLDINGSVRDFFENCEYIGIDIAFGAGVDQVIRAHEFVMPDSFDVVISTETLEHDQHWQASLKRMYENLKVGGLFIVTCAGPRRPEHGTARTETFSSPFTTDYYKNISTEEFLSILPGELFGDGLIGYERGEEDLQFWGIKKGVVLSSTPELAGDTLTVEISTKDRYTTTLPLTISSVLTQTRKPDRLVIYDDGEQKDLRTFSPFNNLLMMASDLGIDWEVLSTPRLGQVANHQHALENAKTTFILRVDDDVILEPNVIEELSKVMVNPAVGAVAPLIHHPGNIRPLPANVTGSMDDIGLGLNMQWFAFNGAARETEHLYSSFMYRVSAARKAGGFPRNLSRIGHREESLFTHAIKRAGYKLIVTPYAKMWHLRESTGGIRSFKNPEFWEHDEQIFQTQLKAWGVTPMERKTIVLDCGLGDHFAFKSVLPQIRAKHPNLTLSVCYPEVFENEGIPLISIADAKLMFGDDLSAFSAYKWAWDRNWTRPMAEAFLEMNT